MPQFYVYIYRDPSRRNEPIYVGKGQDDRAYVHLTRKDKHPFTHRLQLMKRNGIRPVINVIDMPSEALAMLCEVDTIARFGRKDLGLGPLLNLTDGGEGASGYIPSEEHRQNISNTLKGRIFSTKHLQNMSIAQKGENHHNFGKSRSAETCQKLSDAHKGKPRPRVTCPHCGKEGGEGVMHRWHFDNCKYKKQLEK